MKDKDFSLEKTEIENTQNLNFILLLASFNSFFKSLVDVCMRVADSGCLVSLLLLR